MPRVQKMFQEYEADLADIERTNSIERARKVINKSRQHGRQADGSRDEGSPQRSPGVPIPVYSSADGSKSPRQCTLEQPEEQHVSLLNVKRVAPSGAGGIHPPAVKVDSRIVSRSPRDVVQDQWATYEKMQQKAQQMAQGPMGYVASPGETGRLTFLKNAAEESSMVNL